MAPLLESVGLVDLLHFDPRPTFVVSRPAETAELYEIIHRNPTLTVNPALSRTVAAISKDAIHKPFWGWITSEDAADLSQTSPSGSHSLSYQGIYWTRFVVQGTWIVVSGNDTAPSSEPPHKIRIEAVDDGTTVLVQAHSAQPLKEPGGKPENKVSDWIRAERDQGLMLPDFSPDPEPFLEVIQSVDWDSHTLGPMDEWPVRLQEAFHQVIPDSRAIAIYWGPQRIAIYNESFSKFCGSSHPALLGSSALTKWPHLEEQLDRVCGAKCSKIEDETRFFVDKPDGTMEETYIKWSLTPIMDRRKCLGVQHTLLETTSARLWERRMKMLIDLGDTLVTARDVKCYWSKTIEELERWSPTYDVPLAFVYSVRDDDENDSTSSKYGCPSTCRLEGALGVPKDHPIAPPILKLRDTDEGLAPMFREAVKTRYPLLLQTKDGTLPERLLHGLKWRGFGDACQAAIICPIRPTKEENLMGILFLGLNPRRPYDNDYRQFISLLNQKLTSSLASTVLLEEEARRGRNAAEQAAYDTAMLQEKLAYQTEQANESIQNFKAVAEFIPVGMSFLDNQGNVTFANDSWHRITGYPKGPIVPGALLECVLEEDKPIITRAYEEMKTMDVVTFEFRVPWFDQHPADDHLSKNDILLGPEEKSARHVLASAKSERAADGTVIRLLTCLTDVTVQKHAAEEAVRRAQLAESLKRLAEFATVGMYDMNMDGSLLSANELFWEMTGLRKVDLSKVGIQLRQWQACVVDEDLPVLWRTIEELKITGRPQTAEIRFKTSWKAEDAGGHDINAPRWVLATFIPVKTSEGNIQSFTGCLSDVSLQKWQLEQEKLRKEEAIESKRQQENFIDMTSHEMRNPLSAILHCTDAIIASLVRVQDLGNGAAPLTPQGTNIDMNETLSTEQGTKEEEKRLLDDSIENAETIVTCAQHQKRIVDDILTMSKLDSKLLAVTPFTVDPIQIVHDALKMFEVEARRTDIVLTSMVDKSYINLGHEYLDFDPSRIKQILINLLTNALKFTKTGKTRNVTIRIKGSMKPPERDMTAVEFIPRFCDPADEYEQLWLKGRENPVYLLFEVEDTGQGLTTEEMSNLFNKFVQASAKTHVKYGGSGLGLFISRRLTELQNGAIGVSSQPGVGSTFAFYIEAYVPSADSRKKAVAEATAAKLVASLHSSSNGYKTDQAGSNATRPRGASRDTAQLQTPQRPWTQIILDGILVVEDNLINQQITRRGLHERGYSVDVANHGLEALDKLRKSVGAVAKPGGAGTSRSSPKSQPIPINMVLMDVEMPVQDGLTCTRQIRKLEREGTIFCASGGRIPIISVTANARPEQIIEAKEAGCDDVLVKPYRIPELIEMMQVVVRRVGGLSPDSPEL